MDELQAIAKYLREQLREVNDKIESLAFFTLAKMRKEIAEDYDTPKMQEFILKKDGFVDKIIVKLNDMRMNNAFCRIDSEIEGFYVAERIQCFIGNPESPEWRKFQIIVINRILQSNTFKMRKNYDEDEIYKFVLEVITEEMEQP